MSKKNKNSQLSRHNELVKALRRRGRNGQIAAGLVGAYRTKVIPNRRKAESKSECRRCPNIPVPDDELDCVPDE
ncbi:MAG: hypothetical protein JRN15_17835 [Nitrososphaerota archaeon]|nr:hypothetical protein [Nitrososphaerota archaeon]